MRHIEQEPVAIDAIAELGIVFAIPGKDDGLVVIRINCSSQIIGRLADVFVTTRVIQGAQQSSLQFRRRTIVFINHLILRIFHLKGDVANGRSRLCPVKIIVAKSHLEPLQLSSRSICGQKVDIGACSVLHRDATAVPTVEIRRGHDDRPFAIGTKDCLGMRSAAIRRTIHSHNGIIVLVEERHFVVACHGLSGLDILDFVNDDAIAHNDNLIKIGQRFASLSLGRIGPC